MYQKIRNLFAIGPSSAHNFHLHDENSANKKRDKTTHFFEISLKALFVNFSLIFLSIPKLPNNYQSSICHFLFIILSQNSLFIISTLTHILTISHIQSIL